MCAYMVNELNIMQHKHRLIQKCKTQNICHCIIFYTHLLKINKKERGLFISAYLPKHSPLGLDTWQLLSAKVFWLTFGANPLALFMSTTFS